MGCTKCTVYTGIHLREDGYDMLLTGPWLLLSRAAGMHQNSKLICMEGQCSGWNCTAITKVYWATKPLCCLGHEQEMPVCVGGPVRRTAIRHRAGQAVVPHILSRPSIASFCWVHLYVAVHVHIAV